MNTHEDNLRDLFLTYCEDCGLDEKDVRNMLENEPTEEIEGWLSAKTKKVIHAILYL